MHKLSSKIVLKVTVYLPSSLLETLHHDNNSWGRVTKVNLSVDICLRSTSSSLVEDVLTRLIVLEWYTLKWFEHVLRLLENLLKMSWRRVNKTSLPSDVLKISWRMCDQGEYNCLDQGKIIYVLKTFWRRLVKRKAKEVFKSLHCCLLIYLLSPNRWFEVLSKSLGNPLRCSSSFSY